MQHRRYSEDDPWVPTVLNFPQLAGRDVLEIGHGMGCDLATAAQHGARVSGIDLTPRHHEICKAVLDRHGIEADLQLGNAGNLPFASQSQDVVYSLGVLHHTDNTEECVAEAHRVLRPGGTFIVALYHYWSLPHLWFVARGILNGDMRRIGYQGVLSKIEAGADGVVIRPLVKLYTRRSVRNLLRSFSRVDIGVHGLAYDRIPAIGRYLPSAFGRWLERRFGWYVVATAIKLSAALFIFPELLGVQLRFIPADTDH